MNWGNDQPAETVSVVSLHSAATTIRRVARGAPHLDPGVAEELLSVAGSLDVIADRERIKERVFQNGGG